MGSENGIFEGEFEERVEANGETGEEEGFGRGDEEAEEMEVVAVWEAATEEEEEEGGGGGGWSEREVNGRFDATPLCSFTADEGSDVWPSETRLSVRSPTNALIDLRCALLLLIPMLYVRWSLLLLWPMLFVRAEPSFAECVAIQRQEGRSRWSSGATAFRLGVRDETQHARSVAKRTAFSIWNLVRAYCTFDTAVYKMH